MQVVEVDRLDAQARQALLAVLDDDLRPSIHFALALGVAEHAALGCQHHFVPAPLQYLAKQRFVGAKAVQRRRIQVRVAQLQRLEHNGGRVLRRGRGAVRMREAHATKADR